MTLLIISLLTSTLAFGNDCSETKKTESLLETKVIDSEIPKHLKGATISITLADGSVSTVPAERFKVVPRKQQRVISKILEKSIVSCRDRSSLKNRISLLAGYGPRNKLLKDVSPDRVEIRTSNGINAGIQYQRLILKDISIGGQVQSNETGSLMLGLDF